MSAYASKCGKRIDLWLLADNRLPTASKARVGRKANLEKMVKSSPQAGLALVDAKVLDHFIVASARVLSFAERGLIGTPFEEMIRFYRYE